MKKRLICNIEWVSSLNMHYLGTNTESNMGINCILLPLSLTHYGFLVRGAGTLSPPSVFCFLCLLRFFSPSLFFTGGVGSPFFFFFRQLRGLGLLCFFLRFLPRLSPSWPMPCSSFRLQMLCCWAGVTSSPSWTDWTWSKDAWLGLSSTIVLRMMYSRGTPGIFFKPAVTPWSWRQENIQV